MKKFFGVADGPGGGTFDAGLLQSAEDFVAHELMLDRAETSNILPHGGEVGVPRSSPERVMATPFSRTFVAKSFSIPGHPRFLEEWDELARTMSTKMPFQCAHWNQTWWSQFQRRGLFLKDELHLLCATRGERIVGIVPLFKTTIGLPGLPILRYLRLLGADGNLTEWRSVICRDEDRKALQARWVDEACKFKFGFCLFHFRGFSEEEVAAARFDDIGFVKMLLPRSENFVVRLTDSWESFKTQLKRNIKESLRHCYNSLKHADLSLSFSAIDDAEVLRSKMGTFYHWHTLRAKNTQTVAHPDYFKKDQHKAFIESLATRFCPQGKMKLFELKLNDRPVAYRLAFVEGDTLYLYFSAYDPEFSKFSIMTTLVAEAIKWAIAQRIKYVNLSFGRDNSKIRWGPEEFYSYDALVGTRGIWLIDGYRWALSTTRTLVKRLKERFLVSADSA
jgi:CelD/BcsL family acetyltransferase involved in cellulose biosynthesis